MSYLYIDYLPPIRKLISLSGAMCHPVHFIPHQVSQRLASDITE